MTDQQSDKLSPIVNLVWLVALLGGLFDELSPFMTIDGVLWLLLKMSRDFMDFGEQLGLIAWSCRFDWLLLLLLLARLG